MYVIKIEGQRCKICVQLTTALASKESTAGAAILALANMINAAATKDAVDFNIILACLDVNGCVSVPEESSEGCGSPWLGLLYLPTREEAQ